MDPSRIAVILIFSISVTVRFSWAQSNSNSQSQGSLCIDPSSVQQAAKTDGITDGANTEKFSKSLTSSNNFIQFCAGKKLTNGEQNPDGSCNPTPMGLLPSSKNMPSVRILAPSPTKKIAARQTFDVIIATRNIELGFFTSPANTYYVAPQQLNAKGQIKGHVHLVIQLVHKGILDPQKFVFFKGIADPAVKGNVNTTVTGGLPDGVYRISTLTSSMNHQPVVVPVAKRGAVDDAIYVVVGTGVSAPDKTNEKTSGIGGGGSSILSIGGSGNVENNNNHEDKKSNKHKKGKRKKVCRAKLKRKRSNVSKR